MSLYMSSEAHPESLGGIKHRLTVSLCLGDIENYCRLWNVVDILSYVELPKFVHRWRTKLRDAHGCRSGIVAQTIRREDGVMAGMSNRPVKLSTRCLVFEFDPNPDFAHGCFSGKNLIIYRALWWSHAAQKAQLRVGAGVRFGSETRGGSFSRRQPAGEAPISGDDIGDGPRTCPEKETLYDQSPRLAKQIPEPSTAFYWNSRVFDKVCDLRLFRGVFFLNNELQAADNSRMRSTA